MIRRLMFVALCAVGVLSFASSGSAVDLDELKKEVKDGKAVLLDVREEVEWKKAHLSKAELVPLSTIATDKHAKSAIEKYTKDPDLKVYTYCRSGRRSVLAADMFKRVDAKVIAITQSYQDLVDAGFKETKDTDPKFDPPIDTN
ncbi:molybdopterin biosynthesis protein MoeB [Bremerella volcania]|uniref:Molybdopterin biosynthesis protein MoeB n=1 Tax=Bremerella volcania TaxID=2527984 RepID=A0A518CDG1_9BACT|nr:rhodanese-like domain-containing protein [Bremerella volcania]QDU77267.1 molybdopterin biosynthesis protein MoeB [Bremerella volcania]